MSEKTSKEINIVLEEMLKAERIDIKEVLSLSLVDQVRKMIILVDCHDHQHDHDNQFDHHHDHHIDHGLHRHPHHDHHKKGGSSSWFAWTAKPCHNQQAWGKKCFEVVIIIIIMMTIVIIMIIIIMMIVMVVGWSTAWKNNIQVRWAERGR